MQASRQLNFAARAPGVDPGFLKRRFICINVWGFALLILPTTYVLLKKYEKVIFNFALSHVYGDLGSELQCLLKVKEDLS